MLLSRYETFNSNVSSVHHSQQRLITACCISSSDFSTSETNGAHNFCRFLVCDNLIRLILIEDMIALQLPSKYKLLLCLRVIVTQTRLNTECILLHRIAKPSRRKREYIKIRISCRHTLTCSRIIDISLSSIVWRAQTFTIQVVFRYYLIFTFPIAFIVGFS